MAGLSIMIVAGEASGDLHGASLASALKSLHPDIRLSGVGGAHMRAEGIALVPGLYRVDTIGVPGPVTLWKGLANILTLTRWFKREALDGVVFVDNPSMNLRLAKIAARCGHRVIYYIGPQLWAWGRRRLKVIQRVVSRMIVILPFEEPLYRNAGVPCRFVGHPLLDGMAPDYEKARSRQRLGLPSEGVLLGVFPGSRRAEIQSLLPVMMEAALRINALVPTLHCVIGQAPTVPDAWLRDALGRVTCPVTVIPNQPNEVMAAADVLLAASGTVTLQAALIGTPMVLAYRVSWLTALIARMILNVEHIGLVNLVAGRGVVPEVLQSDVTPERLSEEALRLLGNHAYADRMREAFGHVRAQLGPPGASLRAAEEVLAACRV